jgi:hypothetical protein
LSIAITEIEANQSQDATEEGTFILDYCDASCGKDEPRDPVAVGAFSPQAVMFQSHYVAHLIEQFLFGLARDGLLAKSTSMTPFLSACS